jgi:predicted phage terminase large subunit-like protein
VLSQGGYVHVCLPLRFERGRMAPSPVRDCHGRPWQDRRTEEGLLHAPQQFPERAVEEMERQLGSYGVAGQLQQRPAPRGGALFKRPWWEGGRARYEFQGGETLVRAGRPGATSLDSCTVFCVVDAGVSNKATSDPTVMVVFAVAPDGDLYVLWCLRDRLEVEEVVPALNDVCRAWRPEWVGIEANGFQIWFVKEARKKERYLAIPTVRELDPQGKGKAARAAPAVIRAEQGRILLPYPNDSQNPWVQDFEEEMYSFTGKEGRPDDRVDTLAYAVLEMDRLGLDVIEELPEANTARRPVFWHGL